MRLHLAICLAATSQAQWVVATVNARARNEPPVSEKEKWQQCSRSTTDPLCLYGRPTADKAPPSQCCVRSASPSATYIAPPLPDVDVESILPAHIRLSYDVGTNRNPFACSCLTCRRRKIRCSGEQPGRTHRMSGVSTCPFDSWSFASSVQDVLRLQACLPRVHRFDCPLAITVRLRFACAHHTFHIWTQ